MAQDPFKDSRQRHRRNRGNFSLGIARVVSAPSNAGHQVAIQPVTSSGDGGETETRPSPAGVVVPVKGDISLPAVGDLVVFGRFKNRQNVVLGTIYSQQSDIREYDAAERHVGIESNEGTYIHGPFGVVPTVTEDPQSPPDGAVWYRTDLDEYRGVEGGTTVSFSTTAV